LLQAPFCTHIAYINTFICNDAMRLYIIQLLCLEGLLRAPWQTSTVQQRRLVLQQKHLSFAWCARLRGHKQHQKNAMECGLCDKSASLMTRAGNSVLNLKADASEMALVIRTLRASSNSREVGCGDDAHVRNKSIKVTNVGIKWSSWEVRADFERRS